jgi:peroxiredoxin
VAWNGSTGEMQDFVSRHGLTFPQIADMDGSVFSHFDVPVQPAWVFIDGAGLNHRTGELEVDRLTSELEALVT